MVCKYSIPTGNRLKAMYTFFIFFTKNFHELSSVCPKETKVKHKLIGLNCLERI